MDPTSHHNRRRGQTLVEFSITLPILLIMIFGIIEFGRVFQAWVSLQNAARAAARYASTGNVNYDIFDVTIPTNTAKDLAVLDAIVPCGSNTDGVDITPPTAHSSGTQIYGGGDGLFATWYSGIDCEPTNEDHQQLRKDLLRLVAVMYEARESVNALSVESREIDLHYYEKLNADGVRNLLYEFWTHPMPRQAERGWFNVAICSTRGLLDAKPAETPNARLLNPAYPGRFITVRTPTDAGGTTIYPIPFCMLNEIPHPESGAPSNAGKRWLDAGGPGDTVTILVTFNHPLITPLRTGVENFLPMQARRSIVNESFRAPKAVGRPQKSLPTGNAGKPGNIETPDPTATKDPTDTPEFTATYTPTATDTPEPFLCERLVLGWGQPPFNGNTMYLLIENNNNEQIELTQVVINWRTLAAPWDRMWLGAMSMGGAVHWADTENKKNVYGQGRTSVDTGVLGEGYRFVPAQGNTQWEAAFYGAPSNLVEYMSLYDVNSQFTFVARPAGQPPITCVVTKTNPDGAEPTDPPPPTIGPSPSPTPNCVQSADRVRLRFGGLTTSGGVYFNLVNDSGRDLIMQGFKFYWPDRTHPAIVGEPAAGYRLVRVLVGGDRVTNGQRVWQGDVVKGNTSTNPTTYNNPTFGGNVMGQGTPVGTWIGNGTLPAGTTRIWLDFDGFSGSMYDYGARPHHFDKSKVYFACRGGGGNGGGGDSSDGDIEAPIPSPPPTNTPKPTNTRGPTQPPQPATATRTPTKSRTPSPATATYTPAPVTLTPSRTPFGQPTAKPADGGE